MNDEKQDDDNPWDDDDGGRTLTTAGPSFELPSNIPSPITDPPPPPPISPAHPPKGTLVGLMPEDFLASIARGAPPRPSPGTLRSPPRPATIPDDALDDLSGQQDDGPTMTGLTSSPNIPLRDDAAQERLPDLSHDDPESEDATRALTREEMMGAPPGGHQDAHVIVGSDARGDEATLAIAVDPLSPGLAEMGASLDPVLAEALAQRVADHHQQQAYPQRHAQQQAYPQQQHLPPHFPQPPHPGPPHQAYAPPAPPALAQPDTWPVAHPPSGPHPVLGPPPSQPLSWGAPHGFAPPLQPQGMMVPPQVAPWMLPPAPAPAPASVLGLRSTAQVLILAGVAVVCLTIFVVGLVLFFTTKF